jgi:hypothetical protein
VTPEALKAAVKDEAGQEVLRRPQLGAVWDNARARRAYRLR